MSRRTRTAAVVPEPVAPPRPAAARFSHPQALALAVAAILVAGIGGGMLYDRVIPSPGVSFQTLLGVPAAAVLAALALLASVWKAKSVGRPGAVAWYAAGLLAWCALGLTRSNDLYTSTAMLAVAAAAVALGFACARLAREPVPALVLAGAIAAAATFVAAMGVSEYLVSYRAGDPGWRVFSGFVNPDFLAGYLLVTIPVTAALFPIVSGGPRALSGLGLLLQAVCLYLTGSRLGLAALVCELAVMGVLLFRNSAVPASARRVLVIAGAVMLVGLVVAGRPLLMRLLGSGADNHSAQFRVLTWRGTVAMVRANPLLGTGIGSYESAYPPYAVVGYTQHAHNSFLQVAAETGAVGVAALAGLLAAVLLPAFRGRRRTASGGAPEEDPSPSQASSGLLASGCTAAVVGAVAHNLFDSDLYIPATVMTLAAVMGILTALTGSRTVEQETGPAPSLPVSLAKGACAFLTLLLVYHGGRTAGGRLSASTAAREYDSARVLISHGQATGDASVKQAAQTSLASAIEGYRAATSIDPGNLDYGLKLASLYEATGRTSEAEREYRRVTGLGSSSKAWYRYGKLLLAQGKPAEAYEMYRKSWTAEPNNLQNLLALASTAQALGRPEEAEGVYWNILHLYHSDFGQVRAIPELVTWEFGVAQVNLAEMLLAKGDKERSVALLRDGCDVLWEFWNTRTRQSTMFPLSPEVLRNAADRLDWGLEQRAKLMEEARDGGAAEVRNKLEQFRRERKEETSAGQSSGP